MHQNVHEFLDLAWLDQMFRDLPKHQDKQVPYAHHSIFGFWFLHMEQHLRRSQRRPVTNQGNQRQNDLPKPIG